MWIYMYTYISIHSNLCIYIHICIYIYIHKHINRAYPNAAASPPPLIPTCTLPCRHLPVFIRCPLRYCQVHIAAEFGMQTEREAFVTMLAKYTYLDSAKTMGQRNIEVQHVIYIIYISIYIDIHLCIYIYTHIILAKYTYLDSAKTVGQRNIEVHILYIYIYT